MLATPQPLAEAVKRLSDKTPIGSILRSAEWAQMPLELRDRAFFSAGVESVRVLQQMQDRLLQVQQLQRSTLPDGSQGAYFDRQKFIVEMQQLATDLGLDPRNNAATADKSGTLQDITSAGRLGLIYDIQTQQAQEYAKWKMEQDPDVLDAYPAQELIRVEQRKQPRLNWPQRFQDAGGTLVQGRMVALKNSPVWSALSRFQTPYPPFDYNSGMGLEDISRSDAEDLGLIQPNQKVQPAQEAFNAHLQASVQGLSQNFLNALKTLFGNQISIESDTVSWKGGQS